MAVEIYCMDCEVPYLMGRENTRLISSGKGYRLETTCPICNETSVASRAQFKLVIKKPKKEE